MPGYINAVPVAYESSGGGGFFFLMYSAACPNTPRATATNLPLPSLSDPTITDSQSQCSSTSPFFRFWLPSPAASLTRCRGFRGVATAVSVNVPMQPFKVNILTSLHLIDIMCYRISKESLRRERQSRVCLRKVE